jgi:Retrotransposon gag protein
MPPRQTQNSRLTTRSPLLPDPVEDPLEEPLQETIDNPPDPPPEDLSALNRQFEDESTPNLAEAILLMTSELRRRETAPRPVSGRVKEPDTFDGSDPRKLNNFILLCNLYFRNNPSYSEDEPKVTFALSHLRGTALEYFEPAILESDETPDWMDNWSAFIRTLRTQFGPVDPTADAEDGIDNLRMQDNQHIVKYNVEFNRLAIQTGWDDGVLRHRYYSGLAERIKDIMGQQGKPSTLEAMKLLAHSIDARHWERSREKSRSDKGKSDSGKSDPKSDKKTPASGNSNPNHKNTQNNKSAKPAPSSGNSASLSDKLGKDGKLTPQERQRRFENNLCMFCGKVGHMAKDCLKSSSSASKAKGRAAQAKEKEKESPDPKKD